ncbi:MAG: hypothetical protein QOH06_1680 [Acidobacteriota bacterium]|nr:hypothetical protein [Acidobacteriota bacterium]
MPILGYSLRLAALGGMVVLLSSPLTGWCGDPQNVTHAARIPFEDLTVVAIDPASAPAEARAVLQLPGGELQVVMPGEELRAAGVRIRKILPDRLIIDEVGGSRRQAWIFRARPGERSRVQVLDRERPAVPPIVKPQSSESNKSSGNG